MSLTSFIDEKDIRAKFREEFPSVRFKYEDRPVLEPLSTHYQLVGTAFDYLLRFRLQHCYPHAVDCGWVASLVIGMLGCDPETGETTEDHLAAADCTQRIVDEAREHLAQYLQTGGITTDLLRSALLLAQTDLLYRAGTFWEPYGVVDSHDIEDLKRLIRVVPIDQFRSQSVCLLNPCFGASMLVGGADCDLILDHCMIDIKTVQQLKVTRHQINQLIGYYTLYRLGGIRGMPDGNVIDTFGIYFARHGYLLTFPVSQYIREATFSDFMTWFEQRAKQYHLPRFSEENEMKIQELRGQEKAQDYKEHMMMNNEAGNRCVGSYDALADIIYSWPSVEAMMEAKKTRDFSQQMSHTFAEAMDLGLIHPLEVHGQILKNEEAGLKTPLSIKEDVEKRLKGLPE